MIIENDTVQWDVYDFLSRVIHSNHCLSCTVSEISGDIGRNTQIFHTQPVYNASVEGLTLGIF